MVTRQMRRSCATSHHRARQPRFRLSSTPKPGDKVKIHHQLAATSQPRGPSVNIDFIHSETISRFKLNMSANQHYSQRCLLRGCNQKVSSSDTACCSLFHSSEAVRLGEACVCVYCRKMAQTPGFPTCSKTCGALLANNRRHVQSTSNVPPRPTAQSSSRTDTLEKDGGGSFPVDVTYSCGCSIRILKSSAGASAPKRCPVCPSSVKRDVSVQTDQITEKGATADEGSELEMPFVIPG